MNFDKFTYVTFLSIGTVVELATAFGFGDRLAYLSLIYILGFFWIVFKLSSMYYWIWNKGFLLIGLISIVTLILRSLDMYNETIKLIDGLLCAVIYFVCLVKMHSLINQKQTQIKQ